MNLYLNRLRDNQLKNLFIQAPVAMSILTGPDFSFALANELMLNFLDKTWDEINHKPAFEAMPDIRNQGFEQLLESVYTTGKKVSFNERCIKFARHGKMQELYIKLVLQALHEEDGSISGVIILIDDITEMVQSRKKIAENEIRLRTALQTARIATFEVGLQNSNFHYSDILAEIFGFHDPKGHKQADFAARIHPEDESIRIKAHQVANEKGTLSYEARVVWPDQSIHWIRVNGKIIVNNEKPAGLFGTVVEITDQMTQSEKLEKLVADRASELLSKNEALKRSEERYHKMITEVQDYAIILLDQNGIIQNWNKGAERIKQYKEKEVVGRPFQIFYLPKDRSNNLPDKLLNQARETGRAMHEGWRLRKDQTRFWGLVTITALHDEENNVIGFSKVTRDLTEKKLADDKLKEYTLELESQNRELEQFAYVASHDLQEPLRKIQTFAEIIQQKSQQDGPLQLYVEKINASARRMSELIKSVLNYGKLSRGGSEMTPVDLNVIVTNAIADFELVIEEKRASIKTDPLPVVNGIALQVNQVFVNLIGNALKFCKAHPRIEISSRKVDHHQVLDKPEILLGNMYHEISFKDNGIGFEKQYQKQIFAMFQRLHAKHEFSGTGIGLALCKKIMENHNGHITARSEPGIGSTFYIYFPIHS